MKQPTLIKAKKVYKELKSAIMNSDGSIRKDYVIGFYRHMAKIGAIENVLIKKGIITKEDILKEEIPILKAMKKDFSKK
jgi:hypothetical protein